MVLFADVPWPCLIGEAPMMVHGPSTIDPFLTFLDQGTYD